MMPSIALNPAFRTGDRSGPRVRLRAVAMQRPRPVAAASAIAPAGGAVVDLDDPRDGARAVVWAMVAAALVAFVLVTLLVASAPRATTQDVDALAPPRTTEQTTPAFTSSGPTVSIPTGPALFVTLAQGQD